MSSDAERMREVMVLWFIFVKFVVAPTSKSYISYRGLGCQGVRSVHCSCNNGGTGAVRLTAVEES